MSLHIGSRIQIGKDRATVLFIGTVKGTKGEWLGIEWDDPKRGKHEGLHQDTRYFTCRYPTSGSFVRYHAEKIVTGTTFMKALKDRYTVEDSLTTVKGETYDKTKDIGELYFGGNKQIVVETYGFEKILREQRGLSSLTVVGLAEQFVASAGVSNEISEAKLAIEDLDLSRDLIANWQTISEITSQLPHLMILRINQSRLAPPIEGLSLQNIRTLSLNQTMTSWNQIGVLAPQMPHLQDLQLGGNEISELGSITQCQSLVSLNLEDNLIADWTQVATLGALPNLEILFLNDNRLTSVQAAPDLFKKLRFLRIENNNIIDSTSIDALDHYPSLTKLRCKGNPVFSGQTPELETTQIVGRIKMLSTVNGNTVTNRERVDLERFYLKSCTVDGDTHEAIGLKHPRYLELCKIHGEPDLQVKATETQSALKNRLIQIKLTQRTMTRDDLLSVQWITDLSAPTHNSISKRFLPTMTIRNLKNMIQRLLKIPAIKQQLFLLQSVEKGEDRDIIPMDINDELRDLKFYSISDGDEITILTHVS